MLVGFYVPPLVAVRGGAAPFARQTHDARGGVRGVVAAAGRGVHYAWAAGFVGSHDAHCGFGLGVCLGGGEGESCWGMVCGVE